MPLRIEDYALLGDCETAALVGRDGSVDWLCWPRFDSNACFAALLGNPRNGRWLIAPQGAVQSCRRRYRGDSLILETDFETAEGAVTLVDFMPPRDQASRLIRLVIGRRGRVAMGSELLIRFDYGALVPWVTRCGEDCLSAVSGPDRVVLQTSVPFRDENQSLIGEFAVNAGETVSFLLSYGPSYRPWSQNIDSRQALAKTEAFWRDWISHAQKDGAWSDVVRRSLVTLKALIYAPTGGIVAAPTTSLPEQAGGIRNWDYRFCWLRDATFTLLALMNCGYYQEAQAWRDWLLRAVAGDPAQVQIMYGLAGEHRLTECLIPWLPGYEGARPVRIGNAAAHQVQLDIYGEVMDALYHASTGTLNADQVGWSLQQELLKHLECIWNHPDRGIWEVRGEARHFTYSKVMAWVAFDRPIRCVERFGLGGPVEHWRKLRKAIHDDVCAKAFNPDIGAFTQSYGSKELDASALLMPLVGFLPPDDPRMQGTVAAIEHELLVNGLVRRYDPHRADDGLPGGEGSFLACTFWLADNLVLQGRTDEAGTLFERLLALRNDLGLLAEEYDPHSQRQLGNFPQAFSHIALINTAHNSSRISKPAEQRSGHQASP